MMLSTPWCFRRWLYAFATLAPCRAAAAFRFADGDTLLPPAMPPWLCAATMLWCYAAADYAWWLLLLFCRAMARSRCCRQRHFLALRWYAFFFARCRAFVFATRRLMPLSSLFSRFHYADYYDAAMLLCRCHDAVARCQEIAFAIIWRAAAKRAA